MMQVMKKFRMTMFNGSIFLGLLLFVSCAEHKGQTMDIVTEKPKSNAAYDTATFGTGCFWCTEAIFQRLNGVVKVTSGYGAAKF
jgi:peptide-methionine (S)-S-oxide reductase